MHRLFSPDRNSNPRIKGALKGSFEGSKETRKLFPHSTAQITISIGQPVHEGERFQETIRLVNQFKNAVIMVDDSLQWRTLGIADPKATDDALIKEAISMGDEWLERNKPFYSQLTIPYSIVRWKDWVDTPEYLEAIQFAQDAYANNAPFRKGIEDNIQIFLERFLKQHPLKELSPQAAELCRQYAIEETGVMVKLWPRLKTHFEVYPSKRNPAMDAAYQLWIKKEHPDLLQPVSIRFKRHYRETMPTPKANLP